jgi:hypothetical protein
MVRHKANLYVLTATLCLASSWLIAIRTTADAPAGRYSVNAGVAKDNRTALSWQQTIDASAYDWSGAKSYCTKLALDGGGWRLPTYKEALTLIDPTSSNPAIDPSTFPGTPGAWFWTSSPYAGLIANHAWQVFFFDGTSIDEEATKANRVRCVR